jgi:hypothetical protein
MNEVKRAARDLLEYCRTNDWAGYDPYDALNSRLSQALPLLHFRWARLALTQGVKRCPVNLRPLLMVPKSSSSKGIALFLSALSRLAACGWAEAERFIEPLAERLMSLRSPGRDLACWGYNFDWQQRFILVPKNAPNIICTAFAANALLDAYERKPVPAWADAAVSSADFVLRDLFHRESGTKACFNYTLEARDEVHNANLLGAAFLSRIARLTGDAKYLGPALDAARWSAGRQAEGGSWPYGEAPAQRWIDNFHTGFNLVALRRIRDFTGTDEFELAVRRGFDFYKAHFFRKDGAPRYYHDATYPIDIHSVAQSLITLIELRDVGEGNIALARSVLDWALRNMRSLKGYFYFQKRRSHTVRTPFMRWSQAWMLLALSAFVACEEPSS